MQQKILVRSLIAAGVVAALVTGYSRAGVPAATQPQVVAAPAAVTAPAPAAQLPGFNWIVEKYGPAVVNITVSSDAKTGGEGAMACRGSTQKILSMSSSNASRVPCHAAGRQCRVARCPCTDKARASSSAPTGAS